MSRKYKPTVVHTHIAPAVIYWFTRAALSTCRLTVVDGAYFEERGRAGRNMILASWHNRLVTLPYYYYFTYGFTNLAMMVSQSRDGEMFKRLLARYKITAVRGSGSRGATSALRTLVRAARAGHDTSVALDGSKGPRYRVQSGVLMLAKMTGVPILPVTIDATRKIRLKTWDRMIVPLPFSRMCAVFGEPMTIPRDAVDLEPYRRRLQDTMDSICARAAMGVSRNREWFPSSHALHGEAAHSDAGDGHVHE